MDSTQPHNNRGKQTTELGDLHEEVESYDYPATTEGIIDVYGDLEFEYQNKIYSVKETLSPLLDQRESGVESASQALWYDSPAELREVMHELVENDAVN